MARRIQGSLKNGDRRNLGDAMHASLEEAIDRGRQNPGVVFWGLGRVRSLFPDDTSHCFGASSEALLYCQR